MSTVRVLLFPRENGSGQSSGLRNFISIQTHTRARARAHHRLHTSACIYAKHTQHCVRVLRAHCTRVCLIHDARRALSITQAHFDNAADCSLKLSNAHFATPTLQYCGTNSLDGNTSTLYHTRYYAAFTRRGSFSVCVCVCILTVHVCVYLPYICVRRVWVWKPPTLKSNCQSSVICSNKLGNIRMI